MKFFLGLQITQFDKGIFISQSKYVKELLKKFGLNDSKPVGTPMVTGCKMTKEDASLKANQTRYRSMIGGLLCLNQNRPDIMNVVCLVARFQANPKESHVTVIKRIFRYLKGTFDFGLWYPKNDDFTLSAFTSVDWAGDVDDIKSTTGGAFFLGKHLVSWESKNQNAISLSTVEVEYIVVASNCTQVIWIKQMLKDIRVINDQPIAIYYDNSSVVNISKNLVLHSKTKHISIKYHFFREKVNEEEVGLEYVSKKEQIANIFTKPLPKNTFEYLQEKLGVMAPPDEN